jgi:hypothetical protein
MGKLPLLLTNAVGTARSTYTDYSRTAVPVAVFYLFMNKTNQIKYNIKQNFDVIKIRHIYILYIYIVCTVGRNSSYRQN